MQLVCHLVLIFSISLKHIPFTEGEFLEHFLYFCKYESEFELQEGKSLCTKLISLVVLRRNYVEDANLGEGLIVEGTMPRTNGIYLLAKLIKQDSLGVATKIDGSRFIRKDTCQID